jgi:hypothetical protein
VLALPVGDALALALGDGLVPPVVPPDVPPPPPPALVGSKSYVVTPPKVELITNLSTFVAASV